jgi:hypothetical protein
MHPDDELGSLRRLLDVLESGSMKLLLNGRDHSDPRPLLPVHSVGFPLVRISHQGRDEVACPIPTLLFWRITTGLYYSLRYDVGAPTLRRGS